MNQLIMVRYGELSTKGKNKRNFIQTLGNNIIHALKQFPLCKVEIKHDHIYIDPKDNPIEKVCSRLKDVSGIYSFSIVERLPLDIDIIASRSLEIAKEQNKKTFKIKAKRADKSFQYSSDEINRYIASKILSQTSYKVDVHNPELLIQITIREDYCYLFFSEILGIGGYPLSTGGKAMMMLSGGIDSPVASYLMIRRGIKIECVHFASPPYTNEGVISKIKDLAKVLTSYQPNITIHIVPFTKLQEEIYKNVNVSYAITIMRRMMYRIATIIASRRSCLLLANGESLGQVASQTPMSVNVIERVTTYPVIRPLAVMDKIDIIKIARQINTYDISIRPFEDCCTIFEVKDPTTQPSLAKVEEYESKFDYQSLIDECIQNAEIIKISDEEAEDELL